MSARLVLAAALALSAPAVAAAQARIPPNEMAGRERERFTESPFERHRKPQPQIRSQSADPLPRIERSGQKTPRRRPR